MPMNEMDNMKKMDRFLGTISSMTVTEINTKYEQSNHNTEI